MQDRPAQPQHGFTQSRWPFRVLTALALFTIAGIAAIGLALALAYPRLPTLDALTDYRPSLPLRVYTADGTLIQEFGVEKRQVVQYKNVPASLKNAILAAEDDRFFEHSGVDLAGIARAAFANATRLSKAQGGSTITMQLARNFYLSSEKSYARKIYEVLLALRIEASLSKEEILEIYINQIYLGKRAYGFAKAAEVYYGKPLSEISVAQAAMLAGLPKAPSSFNPITNPKRARLRQEYVLGRMHKLGYLDDISYQAALNETPSVNSLVEEYAIRAPWVAEMARQYAYDLYGEDVGRLGLKVYTTIRDVDQTAANAALVAGILDYDRRHGYRGPESFIPLSSDPKVRNRSIHTALSEYSESQGLRPAVVLESSPKRLLIATGTRLESKAQKAMERTDSGEDQYDLETAEITGSALRFVSTALSSNASPSYAIKPGAVIRITGHDAKSLQITQIPEVEAAIVSVDSADGAVRALVGGFDYDRNKFNRVTQAWRQPGSAFKPFVYSAALDKGVTAATLVSNEPLSFEASQTGGQPWEPKNYDGTYESPLSLRQALATSKNMVSIRVLQNIGTSYAQNYVTRFGFQRDRTPPYLTMALGAGSTTLWQMAGAYSVFANGGYKIEPYLIDRITDSSGRMLAKGKPRRVGENAPQVIDPRNAYIMNSLLQEVVRSGTATRARALGRGDLAGKTGTTNDAHDAWFAGYQPSRVAIAWVGFDQPKKLGAKETGGGLALPIWINYMKSALKGVPEMRFDAPSGITMMDGEPYYNESTPGQGVASIGLPLTSNIVDTPTELNAPYTPN